MSQLEQELSLAPASIRANEGEAAIHGIYYDDTEYDYMQHLKDLNEGEAIFIEATEPKKKPKQKLEDALKLPKEVLPSEVEIKKTYQDMQDVPDVLSGFQPDMDPRLREVLVALEDEAYVGEDEDIFEELTAGGEIGQDEFAEDGWESDTTERPVNREEGEGEGEGEGGWEGEYKKFKKEQKKVAFDDSSLADTMSFSVGSTMSVSGRSRRRRRKAGTEGSSYSMSSSALFRTEGLTLLDDRFDKVFISTE